MLPENTKWIRTCIIWRRVNGAVSAQPTGVVIFLVSIVSLQGEIWLRGKQRFLQAVCRFLQNKQTHLLIL